MKHLKSMGIKFIATLIVLYLILGLVFGMSFTNVFFISLVLSVVAYFVGDIGLLPRVNNTLATLADLGLSFIVIWFLSAALIKNPTTPLFFTSFFSAIGVSVFEYFFHKYLTSTATSRRSDNVGRFTSLQYQTEASEEITPEIEKNKENNK